MKEYSKIASKRSDCGNPICKEGQVCSSCTTYYLAKQLETSESLSQITYNLGRNLGQAVKDAKNAIIAAKKELENDLINSSSFKRKVLFVVFILKEFMLRVLNRTWIALNKLLSSSAPAWLKTMIIECVKFFKITYKTLKKTKAVKLLPVSI